MVNMKKNMTFRDFLKTITEEELDFISHLDYGQDHAAHRKALDDVIANGGVVDTTIQGVWFPLEVLELGRNWLQTGHEREYALCAGIVLQADRTGDAAVDLVDHHAEDINALPPPLKSMLGNMIAVKIDSKSTNG